MPLQELKSSLSGDKGRCNFSVTPREPRPGMGLARASHQRAQGPLPHSACRRSLSPSQGSYPPQTQLLTWPPQDGHSPPLPSFAHLQEALEGPRLPACLVARGRRTWLNSGSRFLHQQTDVSTGQGCLGCHCHHCTPGTHHLVREGDTDQVLTKDRKWLP